MLCVVLYFPQGAIEEERWGIEWPQVLRVGDRGSELLRSKKVRFLHEELPLWLLLTI